MIPMSDTETAFKRISLRRVCGRVKNRVDPLAGGSGCKVAAKLHYTRDIDRR